MNLQDWLFIVTAAAALGQVGTLIAMMFQLKDIRKQARLNIKATQNSTRAAVWQEMLTIDKFFCDHPELREQFYGPSKLHSNAVEAQRAEAAAEMILDFAEYMMTQKEHLHHGFDGWRDYYQTLFTESGNTTKILARKPAVVSRRYERSYK